MLIDFFLHLKGRQLPVSTKEFLTLLEGLKLGVCGHSMESFYHYARACLVKDEAHYDRYDRAFGEYFKGVTEIPGLEVELPEEWLRAALRRHLSPEQQAALEKLGWDKLMEEFRKRLEEQQGRHQGGSKWIGTGGTSPFGNAGTHPEGIRVGGESAGNRTAVKVWDLREYRNLDDSVELGTRNIKLALRRLRRWAREGAADELDLDRTIRRTAEQGWLDLVTRPERHNAVKVLLFLDVGGSMDPHVRVVEELFSAARAEFKHLEYFYFHNCLYEGVWRDNRRRWDAQTPTAEILRTYPPDYRVIFVGDAAMSPYEITEPGGANEHWNAESGETWLTRLLATWPRAIWINPTPQAAWGYAQSVAMIAAIFGGRMYPMTLAGLEAGIRELAR